MKEITFEELRKELQVYLHKYTQVISCYNFQATYNESGFLTEAEVEKSGEGIRVTTRLVSPDKTQAHIKGFLFYNTKVWKEETTRDVRFKICKNPDEIHNYIEIKVMPNAEIEQPQEPGIRATTFEEFAQDLERLIGKYAYLKETDRARGTEEIICYEKSGYLRKVSVQSDTDVGVWLFFKIETLDGHMINLKNIITPSKKVWKVDSDNEVRFIITESLSSDYRFQLRIVHDAQKMTKKQEEERKQERLFALFDGILSILKTDLEKFNHHIDLTDEQAEKILELEEKFPELVIGRYVGTGNYRLSTLSLLATMSNVLCGKRLAFECDVKTNKLLRVRFLDDGE